MKVRVVEDDYDIARLLRAVLEREGLEAIVQVNHFDTLFAPEPWEDVVVAIIDLMLGSEVTGQKILAYLNKNHPRIRTVVMSADVFRARELSGQCDAVVTKPPDVAALMLTVRSLYEGTA